MDEAHALTLGCQNTKATDATSKETMPAPEWTELGVTSSNHLLWLRVQRGACDGQ